MDHCQAYYFIGYHYATIEFMVLGSSGEFIGCIGRGKKISGLKAAQKSLAKR